MKGLIFCTNPKKFLTSIQSKTPFVVIVAVETPEERRPTLPTSIWWTLIYGLKRRASGIRVAEQRFYRSWLVKIN